MSRYEKLGIMRTFKENHTLYHVLREACLQPPP